ncbi:MAG: hypothetical protein A2X48_16600 [Lentisphaerae bacterium GWF2_49_21]|nr:MAG: hypothetical protein A2X48_16600 [Lentisphaerae bacterium GWF2_49_21]
MIPNPIHKVLSTLRSRKVKHALYGSLKHLEEALFLETGVYSLLKNDSSNIFTVNNRNVWTGSK